MTYLGIGNSDVDAIDVSSPAWLRNKIRLEASDGNRVAVLYLTSAESKKLRKALKDLEREVKNRD